MGIGDQDGALIFADGDVATVLDSNLQDSGVALKGRFRLVDAVDNFGSLNALAGEIKGTPSFEFWSEYAPAGFARGSKILVNGQNYELRTDPIRKGNGKISMVTLKEVANAN
jgi:hypothetical protein